MQFPKENWIGFLNLFYFAPPIGMKEANSTIQRIVLTDAAFSVLHVASILDTPLKFQV